MRKIKIARITTVPISLNVLLKGQLKFMREHGVEVYTASADGPEVKEMITREGVPHHVVPMTRKITPALDIKAVFQTYQWLKDLKPDIVHTHTPKAGIVGMMAARMAGIPHRLHTVAGMPLMESTGIRRKVLERVEELTYRYATHVYPNSSKLKDFILGNLTVDRSKVRVLGNGSSNGIDTLHFSNTKEISTLGISIRQELNISDDAIVFGFVGRVVKDKGINELVSVFTRIHADNPNTHLLLVGSYEPELDPLNPVTLETINKHPQIHAAGFQSDIRPYLSAMDIFTFPSYREGFPNVVLQAACFELPMIVTDINGCNEIVTDNVNGLIVPPKNEPKLEESMRYLLQNGEAKNKLGSSARTEVVEKYGQENIWNLLFDEYKDLVKNVQITD